MKVYKLPFVITPPGEGDNAEDLYLAEIPALPGCQAWGETPELALKYLKSVAEAYIETSRERGWSLPEDVEKVAVDIDIEPTRQILVPA